ncbi:alanine racemase [Tateyamaria sp.]|uniref:alanine racemase n=1 Tax=Tateyamaria sp. TaxID=1929288 RepID=UPI00329E1DCC
MTSLPNVTTKSTEFSLAPDVREEIFRLANNSQKNGQSFYLYDTRIMEAKLRRLRALLPDQVKVFYAAKANPHDSFLRSAKTAGAAGIEIASRGEGDKAIAAGFAPKELIFTGPGKSVSELRWSVENGIRTVHVESLTEAHRLNQICVELGRTQDILIRVNPNFHIHGAQAQFSGDSSKMGVDEDFFRKELNQFFALSNLRFRGLHVYAASGVLDVDPLMENNRRVYQLAQDIEDQYPGIRCDIIDFGGGFGIDYGGTGAEFDLVEYARKLRAMTEEFGFEERELVLELGRYLTADSGWYCTEILDIKNSLGKLQVVCQGGAHHFRRPVALGLNHPLEIVQMGRSKVFADQCVISDSNVFIGGPLCNSADRLAPRDVYVAKADIGDIAVFGLAGAYGLTMSHVKFLSHEPPQEHELSSETHHR